MKFCWHDWKVWKTVDTKRWAKYATAFWITSLPLSLYMMNLAPNIQERAWMLWVPAIILLAAVIIVAIFNIPMYVDNDMPKTGPEDRSCLKCGITQLNATNYIEGDRRKKDKKYERVCELRLDYDRMLNPPKMDKKGMIEKF